MWKSKCPTERCVVQNFRQICFDGKKRQGKQGLRRALIPGGEYGFSDFISNKAIGRKKVRHFSQIHICKREFKNGNISRFCSVFQVIQVISSAKFFSADEVDLSFKSETKDHPHISKPSFWKRDRENVFLQMFKFGEK